MQLLGAMMRAKDGARAARVSLVFALVLSLSTRALAVAPRVYTRSCPALDGFECLSGAFLTFMPQCNATTCAASCLAQAPPTGVRAYGYFDGQGNCYCDYSMCGAYATSAGWTTAVASSVNPNPLCPGTSGTDAPTPALPVGSPFPRDISWPPDSTPDGRLEFVAADFLCNGAEVATPWRASGGPSGAAYSKGEQRRLQDVTPGSCLDTCRMELQGRETGTLLIGLDPDPDTGLTTCTCHTTCPSTRTKAGAVLFAACDGRPTLRPALSRTSVSPGKALRFTAKLTNPERNGAGAAHDVGVALLLPEGVVLTAAPAADTYAPKRGWRGTLGDGYRKHDAAVAAVVDEARGIVTWEGLVLPPGKSLKVKARVRVRLGTQQRTLSFDARSYLVLPNGGGAYCVSPPANQSVAVKA